LERKIRGDATGNEHDPFVPGVIPNGSHFVARSGSGRARLLPRDLTSHFCAVLAINTSHFNKERLQKNGRWYPLRNGCQQRRADSIRYSVKLITATHAAKARFCLDSLHSNARCVSPVITS
jgi:hypothetical protein